MSVNQKLDDDFGGNFHEDTPSPASSQKIRGTYQPPSINTTSTNSPENVKTNQQQKPKSVSWASSMLQMVSLSPTPTESTRGQVVKGGYERLPTELSDSTSDLGDGSHFLSTTGNSMARMSNFIRDTLAKDDGDDLHTSV